MSQSGVRWPTRSRQPTCRCDKLGRTKILYLPPWTCRTGHAYAKKLLGGAGSAKADQLGSVSLVGVIPSPAPYLAFIIIILDDDAPGGHLLSMPSLLVFITATERNAKKEKREQSYLFAAALFSLALVLPRSSSRSRRKKKNEPLALLLPLLVVAFSE